jgi:hypothetical protein
MISAKKIGMLLLCVTESGNINIGRPAAIVITIFKAFNLRRNGKTFVMVHQVAANLVTAIAKSIWKTGGNVEFRRIKAVATVEALRKISFA